MSVSPPLLGTYLVDSNFLIVLACPDTIVWARGLGHTDIIGKSLFDVFAAVLNDSSRGEYEQVLRTGLPLQVTHAATVGGKVIVAETRKIPMQSAGTGTQILTVVHNVTARNEQDRTILQEQKLDSLGVLAGGIAHEFNNLLGGIFGNLNLAYRHVDSTQTQLLNYLDRATTGFDRARHLTQQLLTFSKGGAPVKKHVSLQPICEQAVRLALSGSPLHCELIVPGDMPRVLADANQIRQVITNLLLNARQAMQAGGRVVIQASLCVVESGTEHGLKPGMYVKVSVADNGPGIDATILDRVFDPFFSTRPVGGGLGLATAHSIVTQHGGHIAIQSSAATGTDVTFYLQAATDVATTSGTPPAIRRIASKRILLLEDDAVLQMVTTEMLSRLGWEVETANTGAEAIDRFTKAEQTDAPFGMVIFDLTIEGGMGGLEAMAHLQQRFPHIRGIVSSGYADSPVLSNPEKFGFCARLEKPFQLEELNSALQRVEVMAESVSD